MNTPRLLLTALLCALLLPSCHHDRDHDRNTTRYRTQENRRADRPAKTNEQRRRTQRYRDTRPPQNLDTMPYLPPFTMRWDCPNEPQMLGYATHPMR